MSVPKGGSSYRAEDDYVSEAFDRMKNLAASKATGIKPEKTPEQRMIDALRQQMDESLGRATRAREQAKNYSRLEESHREVAALIRDNLVRYDRDVQIAKDSARNEADDMDRDAFKEVWDAAWEVMRTDFMVSAPQPSALFESVRDGRFQEYMDSQLKAAAESNTK